MVTTAISFDDLERLQALMLELHEAGRTDEAAVLAQAHAVLSGILIDEQFPWLDDDDPDDPEFVAAMEEAERDFAEGRGIPHADVLRRLQALDDAGR